MLTITLSVGDDNIVHSQVKCKDGDTFDETLRKIRLCKSELEHQIRYRNRCPFSRLTRLFKRLKA